MADEQSTPTDDERNPERCVFTDRLLKALAWNGNRVGADGRLIGETEGKLKSGQRRTVWDAWTDEHGLNTGLCIKITDKGAKSFWLVRRVKGSKKPLKIGLGRYDRGEISLADARAEAIKLKKQMLQGIDPVEVRRQEQAEKERQAEETRVAELRKHEHTVKVVFATYKKKKLKPMRSGDTIAATLEREFIPRFGHLAITDVTRKQISGMLHEIIADESKRRTGAISYAARHALSAVRAFYRWAIAQDRYDGLEHSPCDHISAKGIIDPNGDGKPRDRILTDAELRILWRATSDMPYVWGPLTRMLILTAGRLREIAHARWDEFSTTTVTDEKSRAEVRVEILTIPASRMKGKRDHVVPLIPAIDAIIDPLPRFEGGQHLFSATGGRCPITSMGRGKELVDRAMLYEHRRALGLPVKDADLRRHLGLKAGEPIPPQYCIENWRFHDLRRTARSLMSRAGVNPDHGERCLAHKIGGIRGIYDRFEFLLEKRAALEALAALVDRIANPIENVVPLRAAQ